MVLEISTSSVPGGRNMAVIKFRRRMSVPHVSVSVQRLDLQRQSSDDTETVRGQIVISLISRDRGGSGPTVTDATGISQAIPYDPNELPDGYVNNNSFNFYFLKIS